MQIITGKKPKVTVKSFQHSYTTEDLIFTDKVFKDADEYLTHIAEVNGLPKEAKPDVTFKTEYSTTLFTSVWIWYVIEVD